MLAHFLLIAHQSVSVGDTSDVLHSAIFIVRSENVVDLREWVSLAEVLLVELECCLRDSKCHLIADKLSEGASCIDPLGDPLRVIVSEDSVWASADGVEITRDLGCLLELHDSDLLLLFIKVEDIFIY